MASRPRAAKPKPSTRSRAKEPKPAPPEVRPLSLPTLKVLQMVLNMQQLDVKAPDFERVAIDVIRAKGELAEQIEAAEAVEVGARDEGAGSAEE